MAKKIFLKVATGLAGILGLALAGVGVAKGWWHSLSPQAKVDLVINGLEKDPNIRAATILVHRGHERIYSWNKGMKEATPFAFASITKLFTHAVIFQLVDQAALSLDDKLTDHLPEMKDLVQGKSGDLTGLITLRMLMDQTSGLPDYEMEAPLGGTSIMKQMLIKDRDLPLEERLSITRKLQAKGEAGAKAHYSNLNAELLALVAEKISGQAILDLMKAGIFAPLGLSSLAVYKQLCAPLFYGKKQVAMPSYMQATLPSGGLMGNKIDLMKFLQAFYQGRLFDPSHLNGSFRPIFGPVLAYGQGQMKLGAKGVLSPVIPMPDLLGHSGSTGSFAFYDREGDIYLVGTFNQGQQRPFARIYQLLDGLRH